MSSYRMSQSPSMGSMVGGERRTIVTTEKIVSQVRRSQQLVLICTRTPTQRENVHRDLARKFDVVCFLMAVEIERLDDENNKLKYRLKEYDDKNLDRISYENQIRDLMLRLEQAESHETEEWITVTQQNKILEYSNTQYLRELEDLKTRLQQQEDLKASELRYLRDQHEREQRDLVDKLRQQENSRRLAEVESLEQELRNYKGLLDAKNRDIQELQQRLQIQDQQLTQAFTFERKCQDLQLKNSQLQNTLNGLENQYQGKLEDAENWKMKYLKLESMNGVQTQQYQKILDERNRLNLLLQERQDVILNLQAELACVEQYRGDIEKLRNQLQLRLEDIEHYKQFEVKYDTLKRQFDLLKQQSEERVVYLSQEIERLQHLIRQKTAEAEDLQNQLDNVHQIHKKQVESLEAQILQLHRDRDNNLLYQKNLIDVEQRYKNLLTEADHLNSRLESAQANILKDRDAYNREKDQLCIQLANGQDLLVRKTQELEDLRSKYSDLMDNLQDSQDATDKYRQSLLIVESELKQTQTTRYQLEQRIKDLEQKIRQLQDQLNQDQTTLSNQYKLIETMRIQLSNSENLEEHVRHLSKEIDRLTEELKLADEELYKWRYEYSESGSLSRRVQDQLCLLALSFAEVESLRMRVIEKDKEIDEIRRESIAPYRR